MRDVRGKVAFITGGSSGIGQGILRALSGAGMKVAFTYLREEHLVATMRHFNNDDSTVLPIHLDVTDRAAMTQASDEVRDRFGNVDILVNNAGVNIFSPMDSATYDDWDWLIDVNLKGVINGLITFLPGMKEAGKGGHVVNTASMGSFIAGPNAGIYTTTKFAVRGLTESLRYCLAEFGIGVSLLCPGLVVSNIYNSDELRPDRYSKRGNARGTISVERLSEIHTCGMDPLIVGQKTLNGIKNNDAYIFTHPDHKAELRENFDEILRSIPEEEVDPKREEIEGLRRNRINEIKVLIQNMEH